MYHTFYNRVYFAIAAVSLVGESDITVGLVVALKHVLRDDSRSGQRLPSDIYPRSRERYATQGAREEWVLCFAGGDGRFFFACDKTLCVTIDAWHVRVALVEFALKLFSQRMQGSRTFFLLSRQA